MIGKPIENKENGRMVLRIILGKEMAPIDFVIMCIKLVVMFAENSLLSADRRH
jgi:hypothetical protein